MRKPFHEKMFDDPRVGLDWLVAHAPSFDRAMVVAAIREAVGAETWDRLR